MIQNGIIPSWLTAFTYIFNFVSVHKDKPTEVSATKTALNTRCAARHKNNMLSPTKFYNKTLLQ